MRAPARSIAAGVLLMTLASALLARAQDEEMASTPRAALDYFLHATRTGHYDEATAVFPTGSTAGAETARDLRAVLDERLSLDLSKVSDNPEGKPGKTGASVEDIGRIPAGNGSEPVRMMREQTGKWVFTPATLGRVPGWYASLPDRWIRDILPERLLRYGPRDVLWWQWIALVPIALISFGLGIFLAYIARVILRAIARRMARDFDTRLLHQLAGPLILLAAVAVAQVLADFLFFTKQARAFLDSLTSAAVIFAVFWGVLRSIDLGIEALRGSMFAKGRPERLALLPLFSKAAKVILTIATAIEVLQKLGFPAASLLAGLGIGGLALALAAQKTVENLFGSVILAVDQPFRPGDVVQVDGLTGTVESIGLRSTRIRTVARTRVTFPNGRLSDMRIESYAPRDRTRMDLVLSLVQSTRVDQLRRIISEIDGYLRGLPQVHSDPPTVFLTGITTNSLDVSIGLSIDTTDDVTFQKARQDILLALLGIVEQNGSSLATPVRTVRLSEKTPGEPGPMKRAAQD